MKIRFPHKKAHQPWFARVPAKRLNAAFDALFPLCFVPEARNAAASANAGLPLAEQARR